MSTFKEMITVEKEVYEAVLRNSIKVNDLEVENQQLKAALGKQCLKDDMIEQLLAHQTIAIILVNLCKLELNKIDTDSAKELCQKIDQFVEQAIGVKQ